MITIDTEARMLAKAEVFAHLSESQVRQLAFASKRYSFARGEVIIRQGEAADSGFLLLEGTADIAHRNGGEDRVLTTADTGAILGDVAMVSGSPYKVTATASGQVETLATSREVFLQLLEGDNEAMAQVLRSLAERKAWAEQEFSLRLG